MFAIYKKELKVYFTGILGYIVMALYLLIAGIVFYGMYIMLPNSTGDFSGFFSMMNSTFLFFVPILTIRLLAEDKKLGTYEILLTSPNSSWSIILGKFLGVLTFVLTAATLLLLFPLAISLTTPISWGSVVAGYLGMVLSLAFFVAVGMAASSFTDNYVIAGVISFAMFFLLFLISRFAEVDSKILSSIFTEVSFTEHYKGFLGGAIKLKDIAYFIIGGFLWLFVAKTVVESKTWK